MAQSELVLTLPIRVFVDDAALIGPCQDSVNLEMHNFQVWCTDVVGIAWKLLKDRIAAVVQLYLGLWWDSSDFSLSLDDFKLKHYLELLLSASNAKVLSLRDRQSLAGKMQRAVLTLPPGAACLLVNCYVMMKNLVLPWQSKRTTRSEREDYLFTEGLLRLNLGRGYYSYDGFPQAPLGFTDASKQRDCTAGGWCHGWGFYDFYRYGTSAARHSIDMLEGDTLLRFCASLGPLLRGMLQPVGIDNSVIQFSVAKGRSGVTRLNDGVFKHLMVEQLRHGFVLASFWVSSADNFLADHLSRLREDAFLSVVHSSGFLHPYVPLRRARNAGRTVTLDRPSPNDAIRGALVDLLLRDEPAPIAQVVPGPTGDPVLQSNDLQAQSSFVRTRGGGGGLRGGESQVLSISYPRAFIIDGLPSDLVADFETLMDGRLRPSSMDKIRSAVSRWSGFCLTRGWEPLLATDCPLRGGRLAAWVLSLVRDTDLVFKSISAYVWGVRSWHLFQHLADPIMGVMHWSEFMQSVRVLTVCIAEPREEVPIEVIRLLFAYLAASDDFVCIQLHLVLLVLLFTFSRVECPCPKTFAGLSSYDVRYHWSVGDFRLVDSSLTAPILWVRFKGFKQDARMERPSASHADARLPFVPGEHGDSKDWVPIGDVPDDPLFSIALAYKRFVRALAKARKLFDPMFVAKDKVRPYTYGCISADFHASLLAVGVTHHYGLHGFRVAGYNLCKAALGVELTVVHGGWSAEGAGHTRYARYALAAVFGIPAAMVGAVSAFPASAVRVPSRVRGSRHGAPHDNYDVDEVVRGPGPEDDQGSSDHDDVSSPQPADTTRPVVTSSSTRLHSLDEFQCGDPQCLVRSRNGQHPGLHVFPEPTPRAFGRGRGRGLPGLRFA